MPFEIAEEEEPKTANLVSEKVHPNLKIKSHSQIESRSRRSGTRYMDKAKGAYFPISVRAKSNNYSSLKKPLLKNSVSAQVKLTETTNINGGSLDKKLFSPSYLDG